MFDLASSSKDFLVKQDAWSYYWFTLSGRDNDLAKLYVVSSQLRGILILVSILVLGSIYFGVTFWKVDLIFDSLV